MMPMMLPQLSLWGAPLYSELYVGLCRALASPWPAVERPQAGAARSAATAGSGQQRARSAWRLIDSRRADGAIHAISLADLRQTVRDLRRMSDDAVDAEDASPALALD